jgi:hypothetical protein
VPASVRPRRTQRILRMQLSDLAVGFLTGDSVQKLSALAK